MSEDSTTDTSTEMREIVPRGSQYIDGGSYVNFRACTICGAAIMGKDWQDLDANAHRHVEWHAGGRE